MCFGERKLPLGLPNGGLSNPVCLSGGPRVDCRAEEAQLPRFRGENTILYDYLPDRRMKRRSTEYRMRSLMLSENPLYGRIDRTIDLKPMEYYESALLYPFF